MAEEVDRIEREHEEFRAEHKMLLRSQVLFQDSLERLKEKLSETDDKLNGLIGVVEHDHREFHERLKRLNG